MENNLKGELEFLCYLKKRNYPAVVPVASNSGELVVTLGSVWGKYYASVFKGVDRISIEDTDCNDQILFIYGETLGQLHMLSSEYYPKIRKWTYRDVLFWIQKVLEEYHAPDKMLAELEDVRQALDALMENIPEDRQADAKDTFLRGYQSVKTLEHDYTENLKLMRRFCNLYSYARLIRCVAEQYPNEPDWLIGLREKLHRKIKLLENIKRGAYDY